MTEPRYVAEHGTVYHRVQRCRRGHPALTLAPVQEAVALASGLRPCRNCFTSAECEAVKTEVERTYEEFVTAMRRRESQ